MGLKQKQKQTLKWFTKTECGVTLYGITETKWTINQLQAYINRTAFNETGHYPIHTLIKVTSLSPADFKNLKFEDIFTYIEQRSYNLIVR